MITLSTFQSNPAAPGIGMCHKNVTLSRRVSDVGVHSEKGELIAALSREETKQIIESEMKDLGL
jgi:hypothetical protein